MLLSDQQIRAIVTEVVKQGMNDYKVAINDVYDELHQEALNMYHTFIEQYYTYKTTAYIRHGTSKPGTGMGYNLYYGGNKNRIRKRHGNNPQLIIDFSAQDMEGYEHDSASAVLEQVMGGIRGVPPYWFMTWTGSYYGKHFSYSGFMNKAFDTFINRFDDIVESVFYPKWKKMGY